MRAVGGDADRGVLQAIALAACDCSLTLQVEVRDVERVDGLDGLGELERESLVVHVEVVPQQGRQGKIFSVDILTHGVLLGNCNNGVALHVVNEVLGERQENRRRSVCQAANPLDVVKIFGIDFDPQGDTVQRVELDLLHDERPLNRGRAGTALELGLGQVKSALPHGFGEPEGENAVLVHVDVKAEQRRLNGVLIENHNLLGTARRHRHDSIRGHNVHVIDEPCRD